MGYYIRRMDGTHPQVWKIDDRVAVLVDVTNPERGAGTYFEARPGETIWDAIRRQSPFFEPDGQNPFHETVVYTENLIRVDDVMESPKLAE